MCFPVLGKPSPCLPLSYVGTMEGSTTLTSLIHDYCGRYHNFPSCGVEFEWFLNKSSSACKLCSSVVNGVNSSAFIFTQRVIFIEDLIEPFKKRRYSLFFTTGSVFKRVLDNGRAASFTPVIIIFICKKAGSLQHELISS